MNPVELARKIETLTADYDYNTVDAALKILHVLMDHRISALIGFDRQLHEEQMGRAVPEAHI